MRFLADDTLGALVRRLRLLGFDVEVLPFSQIPLKLTAEPDRFFLSRSSKRTQTIEGKNLWVRSDLWEDQLRQVLEELALPLPAENLTRCSLCNVILEEVKHKAEVQAQVPDYVYSTRDRYYRCEGCGKIYWQGSHWQRLEGFIESLKK